jgi:hypothetical protein
LCAAHAPRKGEFTFVQPLRGHRQTSCFLRKNPGKFTPTYLDVEKKQKSLGLGLILANPGTHLMLIQERNLQVQL